MVAYELLSGRHPFDGKAGSQQLMVAQMMEVPPPLAERAPGLPLDIVKLVMQCLEKDPGDRPASGREVRAALDAVQDVNRR